MNPRICSKTAFRPLLLLLVVAAASACAGGKEERKAHHLERGQLLLAERDFAKANVEFRNALQIDPKDANTRALVGFAAEKAGNFEDAIKFYRSALADDPNQILATGRLARMMVLGGLPEEAAKLIDPALEHAPDSALLLSVRSVVKVQKGDLAGARADAARAVEIDANDIDAVTSLAAIMWREGEREAAQALIERTVEAQPDNPDVREAYARLLLQQDMPDEAAVQLAEIVRIEPDRIEHRYRLAQLYLARKDSNAALSVLRKAVESRPDDVELKFAVASVLANYQTFPAAEAQLAEYVRQDPDNLELQIVFARFYEANGRFDQAERIYQDVAEEAGMKARGLVARTRIAALKFRTGDTEAASALLNEVLKENPADSSALVMRADLAMRRGDPAAAIIDLRAALRDQPDSTSLSVALARAHLQAGEVSLAEQVLRSAVQSNPGDVDGRLALAQFLVDHGKPEQARPVLEQLVAEQPNNLLALEGLARLQVYSDDPNAALRTAETVRSLRPGSATGSYLEGLALERQQKAADARAAYERAAKLEPSANDPIVGLVRLDVAEGKVDSALERIDSRLQVQPGNAALQNLRGDLLMSQQRAPDALDSYAAAVKAAPTWAQPYRGQAGALAAMGKTDEAVAVLRVGLQATRGAAVLAADLGGLLDRAGRFEEAIEVFDEMLGREPGNQIAANNLAMLIAQHRDDAASLNRALQLATRLDRENNPAFLDTYGWVLHRLGRHQDALAPLQKAVEAVPQAAELRYHLGMVQIALGDEASARRNLTEAVRLGGDYVGAAEAKQALAKL